MRAQLLGSASKILGLDPKSLRMLNGNIVDALKPGKQLFSIRDILQKLGKTEISANSRYTLSAMSESSGVQLCAVSLDVETGNVKIEKYVVVEDCGRIINRAIVDGQIQGGVVHGVGGALLEWLAYDESGNLLTSTFMDYSIPTSVDSPDVEVFYKTTPSKAALNGAKGVGESGTNASYGAIVNAVNDALSQIGKAKDVNIAPALPDIIYHHASEKTHE
jgi:carbon-monoxide dehydrogenase large subunit